MNEIIVSTVLGIFGGALLTYLGIMYWAKHMEKNKKEVLIKAGKERWEK